MWLNRQRGHIVATEKKSFGMKTKYMLKHPGKLLFLDEVGSNTSQAKGGQIGGEKLFTVGSESRPQTRSTQKDAHFTVLGFTTSDGKPVICAIIFAA